MHKPSSSSLDRAFHCTASHYLPRIDRQGDSARRGTAVHKYLEQWIKNGVRPHVASVDKNYQELCEALDPKEALEGFDPSSLQVEVAFAYNIKKRSTRILGYGIDRNYDKFQLTKYEIPGTVDVLAQGSVPVFLDWKTSYDIGPIGDYWQFRFFALALAQLYPEAPSVWGRVGYIRQEGDIEVQEYGWDRFTLDSYADELEPLLARIDADDRYHAQTGLQTVNAGIWCKYCPSVSHCSAQTALAKSMLPELTGISSHIYEMTDEQASLALDKLQHIGALYDAVEEALKLRACVSPIPRANGKVYAETKSHKTSIDGPKALRLLKIYGAPKEVIAGCKKTTEFPVIREVSIKTLAKR